MVLNSFEQHLFNSAYFRLQVKEGNVFSHLVPVERASLHHGISHLITETDSLSETLCLKKFKTMDSAQNEAHRGHKH
jgi:hypothetical protein